MAHAETLGDSTGGETFAASSHEGIAGRGISQSGESVEDAAAGIVEEENAKVRWEMRVPKSVGIVEETQIADDHHVKSVAFHGAAHGCRKAALNSVHATVAEDGETAGFKNSRGSTDGRTVCQMKREIGS